MTAGVTERIVALTHVPSPALARGERTFIDRVPIDFDLALRQHDGYRAMLAGCGAQVVVLDVNRAHADSVFLEDTAIVLDEIAIITPMGVESRRPEPDGIARELGKYRELRRVSLPATVEGGDVLVVGREILVGLSSRTNRAGVDALREIAKPFGYTVRLIATRDALHFKSACTKLPDDRLLLNADWLAVDELSDYGQVRVPPGDPWGANVTLVGDAVCAASEHQETNEVLCHEGFDVRTAPLSEFAKAEGAVTCMSLVFTDNRR